jgi:regulator of ribonuclease activity A
MNPDFATCDLCDAHKNDSDGAFRVLPPVFRDFGGRRRFAGPVVTVKCFEDNSLVKIVLDTPGQGRVLVVDGGASVRRALVGGNIGAAAARNGWAGVVVDGAMWPNSPRWTWASVPWHPCRCRPRSATRASVRCP